MLEVHFSVPVIKDGILYNLTDIKWDVFKDDEIEQCPFCCHLANIRRRNEARGDKMVPHFRYIGQVFSLEVHGVLIIYFPLALPVCEHPKDFRVVRVFVKAIIGLGVNRLKVIIAIDRLFTEVYQHPHGLGPS